MKEIFDKPCIEWTPNELLKVREFCLEACNSRDKLIREIINRFSIPTRLSSYDSSEIKIIYTKDLEAEIGK